MTGKPSSAVVCCFKVSFTVKWKKNCQIGQRQLYSRIVVWKIIECSKYQLIFVTAEEVLSKPFLSWLKKKNNCPSFYSLALRMLAFCRETVLAVFNLTYFDWLLAPFREKSNAQPIRGFFTFQQPLPASVFSPILCPNPYRPL